MLQHPWQRTPAKYSFPQDFSPITGNISASELSAYLGALGAYLRQGPRLTNLRDTTTISSSSIGRNITLDHLRRLLHLSEVLPREAFATFIIMGRSNYFNFLHAFDLVYPGYYEDVEANTNNASITTIRILITIMAITVFLT